jgi:molybdate transport system permease protein
VAIASAAVAVSLPFGLLLAWWLARRRFFGKTLVEAVVAAPLVLPPIVTGYLLLLLLARGTPVGGWLHRTFGWELLFTPLAAALAAAVVSFPLLVRTLRVAIESVDPGLEDAARTLGANRWTTFRTVTLPLCRSGVFAALVLAFARALGEFGATLVVAGTLPGGRVTAPVAVYRALISGEPSAAVPLVVALVLVALVAMAVSEHLVARARRGERAP